MLIIERPQKSRIAFLHEPIYRLIQGKSLTSWLLLVLEAALAPSAGSNPTAFQAVSFQQPIPIYENGGNGGIQA
jgi:hypothetical protein